MASESDRLGRIEEEVDGLKQDLKKTTEGLNQAVEELKKAIIDIRSTVSEIENPFNLLRVISNEEDLQRARRLTEQQQQAQLTTSPTGEAGAKPKPESESESEFESKKRVEAAKQIIGAMPVGFETGFSVIKWVWALLDAGFEREDVLNLSRYCESVGYLPPRSSEYVGYVVDAMSKARLGGLTLEEFLLVIYGATKASGLKLEMKELEEVAFTLLRKILKKIGTGYEVRQP
ncbi:MAG: hypothetical protein H5T34_01665 [Candidatus Methanomethyliales bacterium]|nr:hypothetical protein [Candidatus Methanomethylicales archaeon]